MQRTLLLSLAHPDDETFYAAGTIARCAAAGVRIVVVCATRGERGSRGQPELCTIEELPAVRERELHAAASILGIEHVHLLDYEDQLLVQAKPAEIRHKLVSLYRQYRPNVLVTFDPNGGSGHSDHVAMSRFSMDAALAAADPRFETEYPAAAITRVVWTPPSQPWALGSDPGRLPGIDFLVDTAGARERKIAALEAYRTQQPGIGRVFLNAPDPGNRLRYEAFRQVWGPALAQLPAGDLFEGL